MKAEASGARWLAPVTFVALALLMLAVVVRYAPPQPKPESAPAAEFSADRAHARLAEFLGDGAPHPTGSAENANVRARIVAELTRLGFAPEVEETLVCPARRACAHVHNIVAKLPGRERDAVLLATHYDSVGAGPGASDDGVGVAALLEIARILKSEPPSRNSIVLLVDDGEELGLLGAEAFQAANPVANDVRVVVNLEARGTTGPSCMFETNHDNAWLIDALAHALSRPVTSSLFYAVYKALPNDTDVTVFKRYDKQALNFAFIGRPTQYHTPLDDLAHADRGSLQHHGDNALAMMRSLADVNLGALPPGDAVWFDVLALGIVRWPESATLGLALVACIFVAASVFAAARRRAITLRAFAWGLASVPAILAATTVLGVGAIAILKSVGAVPSPWIARPLPVLIALSSAAIVICAAIATTLSKRASPWAIWAGTWSVWTLLATALAIVSPSVSFLFLVPAIAAGVGGLLATALRARVADPFPIAALLPILAAAIVWLPLLNQLYDALGLVVGALFASTAATAATTLAPVIATIAPPRGRHFAIGVGAASLATFVIAMAMPPFSNEAPRRASIFYDATSAKPRFIVDVDGDTSRALETPFANELGTTRSEAIFAWMPRKAFIADAPLVAMQRPTIEVVTQDASGGARRERVRLRSARGAPWLEVHVPPSSSVRTIEVVGATPSGSGGLIAEPGGFRGRRILGAPPEGLLLDVTIQGEGSADVLVFDASPGLPAEGDALLRARGNAAVTSHFGDLTLIGSTVTL